ncbi:hypothetical protein [Burkholderia anthina]|uniref:hypothetical protein n=1 Tax=Burkholderia anthina TaxID=179879 RepID=UPI0012D85F2E|nr:hypothetical protein [Burkholderia anthina]
MAIAASACVMSAYAADPNPVDLTVHLAGKVPSLDVFEVKSVGWSNGDEAKYHIPVDWDGSMVPKEFRFHVKSSYGAIHMKLSGNSGGKSMTTGHWRLMGEDGVSEIGVKRQVTIAGETGWNWVNYEKMEVASKDFAAKGDEITLRLSVFSDATIPTKPGISYAGVASAVFETDLD